MASSSKTNKQNQPQLMDALATLDQLDRECTSWANQHAHSCNLLASLLNITRQREQTLLQFERQQGAHHSNTHSSHQQQTGPDTYLLSPKSLQRLVHKQSLEIESVVSQLYETINVFKRVVQAMIALERQVESTLQRMDTSVLLDTIQGVHDDDRPSPSAFASGPSLLDTAEISPLEVLDWVSRIRAMYAQELNVKQAQIHPGMTVLERFESLAELQRSWGVQKRIDFGLEQDIVDRIKAYRRVREFASRT